MRVKRRQLAIPITTTTITAAEFRAMHPAREAPRRTNRKPEAAIQNAVLRLLRLRGWLAIRYNSGGFRVGDTGYFRGYIIAGLNSSAGHPDVVGFKGDRAVFIECKAPGGVLSKNQIRFRDWAERHGVKVWTVESAGEVDTIISREFAE